MRMRRWVIFVLAAPVYTFIVMLALTLVYAVLLIDEWPIPIDYFTSFEEIFSEPEWWSWMGAIAGVFVVSQGVFLIPIVRRRPPRAERGKSLIVSMAIAGAIGAGLFVGLMLSIVTFMNEVLSIDTDDLAAFLWAALLFILVASWTFWSAILFLYVRGIWAERVLGRIVALTFAGTVIELICILPLDIMIRRRTECYCFSGTLVNLAFGVSAMLWLTGPGIVIALVGRKRRPWHAQFCGTCGYEKGPTPGERCPECGRAWTTCTP